jgi:hypothetical protein
MQTTGTVLVAVRQRSVVRMWMLAQSSQSAHRLLYVAAVRDDRLPGPLLHDDQIGKLRRTREPVGQHRPKDLQPLLAARVALALTPLLLALEHDQGAELSRI